MMSGKCETECGQDHISCKKRRKENASINFYTGVIEYDSLRSEVFVMVCVSVCVFVCVCVCVREFVHVSFCFACVSVYAG